FRGAYNALSTLPAADLEHGVCSVSSGNHSQALALAASLLGVRVAVLMPADAPSAKIEATRGYGAEVVTYDRDSMPQAEAGRRFRDERGMTFISSHDDPMIMAGAGTAALEAVGEGGPIDMLVAPIGGRGGISRYATV